MGGGGTQTSTQTQETAYPPWTQDATQGLVGAGFNMNSPFFQTPGFQIAPMTPDQLRGMDMTRQHAVETQRSQMPQIQGGGPIQAHQVDGQQIHEMMSPYLDSVGKSTLGNMRREYQNTDAMMAGRAAAASPFGGSAGAIARGQAARGHGENVGSAINQLMGQGYESGRQSAFQNAAMRQRTDEFNANQALRRAQSESGLMDADQRRRLQATGALTQAGNQQQLFGQAALDVPMRALERYAALVPQVFNTRQVSQTEAPDNSAGPLQQIMGLGSSLLGAAGQAGGFGALFSSDEGKKTNIEPVGTDPETGMQLYAYDYIEDVERAERDGTPMPPKRVGPMAQDIAEESPGLVRDLDGPDGSMIVSMEAPGMLAAEMGGIEGEIMEPGQPAPGPMPGVTDNGDGTVTMPVGLLSNMMAAMEGESMMAQGMPGGMPGQGGPREPGERRFAPPALLNL